MLKKRSKAFFGQKNYSNPFFCQRKNKISGFNNFSFKYRLIFLLILAILLILGYYFLYHYRFNIQNFEISGNNRVFSEDIKKIFSSQSEKRRFIFGSQKNIFLFDKNSFINTLNDNYHFAEISVKTNFPNKLIINLKEKDYLAVWYEADEYYYIDSEGGIISKADPIQINSNDYPLIENRSEKMIIGGKTKEKSGNIDYIRRLFWEFKNNHKDLKIDRFISDNDLYTIKMLLISGPQIYFNVNKDIESQINKLFLIMEKAMKDDFVNKNDIDLRYGDKVYYK